VELQQFGLHEGGGQVGQEPMAIGLTFQASREPATEIRRIRLGEQFVNGLAAFDVGFHARHSPATPERSSKRSANQTRPVFGLVFFGICAHEPG
jgi:hypothetical protein